MEVLTPIVETAIPVPMERVAGWCPAPTRRWASFARLVSWCLLFSSLLQFTVVSAFGQVSKEYQLKAVFLWRFAQFVKWPTNAFENADSPIVIGVLGNNPFGKSLETVVVDETAHGRKLRVQYYSQPEEIKTCHILYVCESESLRVKNILTALDGRSILTVSDIERFTFEHGGMVRFLSDQNKIRFGINLEATTAARLVLDARLLRMADMVRNP